MIKKKNILAIALATSMAFPFNLASMVAPITVFATDEKEETSESVMVTFVNSEGTPYSDLEPFEATPDENGEIAVEDYLFELFEVPNDFHLTEAPSPLQPSTDGTYSLSIEPDDKYDNEVNPPTWDNPILSPNGLYALLFYDPASNQSIVVKLTDNKATAADIKAALEKAESDYWYNSEKDSDFTQAVTTALEDLRRCIYTINKTTENDPTYSITIYGVGIELSDRENDYFVQRKDISDIGATTVAPIYVTPTTNNEQGRTAIIPTVKNVDGSTLLKDTDYTVTTVAEGTDLGKNKGTVTITGINAYKGTKEPISYDIYGDLASVTADSSLSIKLKATATDDDVKNALTTALEITPLKWGSESLTLGTDYEIEQVSWNFGESTGKFTIQEAGDAYKYNPDVIPQELTFNVEKQKINEFDVEVTGQIIMGANNGGATTFDTSNLNFKFKTQDVEPNTLNPQPVLDKDFKVEVDPTVTTVPGSTAGTIKLTALEGSTIFAEDSTANIEKEQIAVVGDLSTLGKVSVTGDEGENIFKADGWSDKKKDAPKVLFKGTELTKGTKDDGHSDYYISEGGEIFESTTDPQPKDYSFTVTGQGDYTGELSFKVTIVKDIVDLTDATVELESSSKKYTLVSDNNGGVKVTPEPTISKIISSDNSTEINTGLAKLVVDLTKTTIGEKGGVATAQFSQQMIDDTIANGTSKEVTFDVYGDLSDELAELTAPTNAKVEETLASSDLEVKYNGTSLIKDTHYTVAYTDSTGAKVDESALLTEGTYTATITGKEENWYIGTNSVTFKPKPEDPAPAKATDLTGATGSITYNADGTFNTLKFTPKGKSEVTLTATKGKFTGFTLNPESLPVTDGKVTSKNVTVTATAANTEYTDSFTIEANKVTAATPEGPSEEKNPLAVQFVTKDTTADTFTTKVGNLIALDGAATGMTVDEQIAAIQTLTGKYAFASKPEALTKDNFTESDKKDDTDYSVAQIKVVKVPVNVQWNGDQDATVEVSYETEDKAITGTVKIPGNSVINGELTADKINKKLIGVKTNATVTINSDGVVGYKDSNTFKGLVFPKLGPITVASTLNSDDTVNTADVKDILVEVTVGEGDKAIVVQVPMSEIAQSVEGDKTKLKLEIDNKGLATALTTQSKNAAEYKYPDNKSKPAPNYEFAVDTIKNGEEDITSSGEADVKDISGITVKIGAESAIRLLIPKKSATLNPEKPIELNKARIVNETAVESESDTIAIIAKVSDVDGADGTTQDLTIKATEIKAYVSKETTGGKTLKAEDGSEVKATDVDINKISASITINLKNPQPLSTVKNNYYEVDTTKDNSGTGEDKDPNQGGTTVTPSKPSSSKPKPEEPATKPIVGTPTSMYRLYNRLTGEHLYTTDKAERDHLLTSDTWKDEGQGWVAPSVSDYPVYRLLNPNTGDHHYTTDKNEFDTLPSYGWVAEGIAFYSADKDDADNVILHRLYNPNAKEAGMHHYTTDENERNVLVSQGWVYEGTAWAGLKSE